MEVVSFYKIKLELNESKKLSSNNKCDLYSNCWQLCARTCQVLNHRSGVKKNTKLVWSRDEIHFKLLSLTNGEIAK